MAAVKLYRLRCLASGRYVIVAATFIVAAEVRSIGSNSTAWSG